MRRYFIKFGCALVSSFFGGCFFFIIGSCLSIAFPDVDFGGDKAGGLWGIIIGMPMGSLAGILIIDKVIYDLIGYNIFGLAIGLVGGIIFGGIGGIFLLDEFGNKALALIPLLIVAFSMFGYQLGLKRTLRFENKDKF